MSHFVAVSECLTGAFEPVPTVRRQVATAAADGTVERRQTLHSAVCRVLGLDTNDSPLVAINHREVAEAIRWSFSTLDQVLGASSQPWSAQANRSEREVLDLLAAAAALYSETPVDQVRAHLRPGITKVTGRGKMRGAIAVEVARVAAQNGAPFGAELQACVSEGASNKDILAALEAVPRRPTAAPGDWLVADAWSQLAGLYFASPAVETFQIAGFCSWLSNRLGQLSDDQLVDLILRRTAEIRAASRQALKQSAGL